MKNPNIHMLEVVAQGLGKFKEEVVFVGGTVTAFYVDDPAAPEARPTNDVDCIVELASTGEYYKLEKELRNLGFKNSMEGRSPLCRWIYKGVIVDVMPTKGDILGFSNQWYPEGIKNKIQVSLPSTSQIYVLALPYFLATKMEAYQDRGKNDPRLSRDIEDIVAVLDGNMEIEKMMLSIQGELGKYLKQAFGKLMRGQHFSEAMRAHLPPTSEKEQRATRLERILEKFIQSK